MIKAVASDPKLDEIGKRMGRVPNMLRVMANSSAVLDGYLGLSKALKGGALPAATAERVALAVGGANGCEYCVAAHTYAGRTAAGLSAEEVEAAVSGTSSDPREAAAVEFARALTVGRGEADPAAALAAGWSEEQVLEIIAWVGLQTLTNYVNKVAKTENDWPVA
ncbi:carboxymuconolactone decarboxylase family protein [Nonomuraea sp. NBC_01738]|uniref:carboxymuconolactone decarboxylase family protein n=1 Tax=Nonomuraea sp. NBC_01738 TaxID=2976003 RepID=UPI002E104FB9|nr:carboxymuconolactone decarboxylase family protein [Nonomuraea sp. NBC_01738]